MVSTAETEVTFLLLETPRLPAIIRLPLLFFLWH
jgi:hypothetical protein